jgi:hypothetical protein
VWQDAAEGRHVGSGSSLVMATGALYRAVPLDCQLMQGTVMGRGRGPRDTRGHERAVGACAQRASRRGREDRQTPLQHGALPKEREHQPENEKSVEEAAASHCENSLVITSLR